ncbi:flagellin-like hook-associated protein FlgL [Paraburkholderia youngii]
MLGINSNINSLVAQQNLSGSGSALSQAITRLSSGKRINSAADDAAGLAISNIMQTQINGLNQGVSNSNDGTSMVQTASSGLASLTNSLQRIRQLATQSANGSMTNDDRAALQKEVAQQISEVNRIASQTTFNGMNLLDGTMGNVSFQVGANVGQTISLNLTQDMSAAKLGNGVPVKGNTLGTLTNLSLDSAGAATTGTATITSINVLSDGSGGFTFTDQNNQALTSTEVSGCVRCGRQRLQRYRCGYDACGCRRELCVRLPDCAQYRQGKSRRWHRIAKCRRRSSSWSRQRQCNCSDQCVQHAVDCCKDRHQHPERRQHGDGIDRQRVEHA